MRVESVIKRRDGAEGSRLRAFVAKKRIPSIQILTPCKWILRLLEMDFFFFFLNKTSFFIFE